MNLRQGITLGLVVAMLCGPVFAQSTATPTNDELQQRLLRIERILDNQVLLDLLQRIETLQLEVRQLRGEIESLEHERKSLSKRQRDLYLDTDRRLQALESGQGNDLDADAVPEDTAVSAAPGATPETDALARSTAVGVRSEPAPGEKDAYTQAYDVLMAGNNAAAIKAFTTFLSRFPTGPYSDNAWYWRGEANYVSRKFDDALASFNRVLNDFPDSPKVPDAKLKVAYTWYEQNQFDAARRELQSLVNAFPDSSAARLARKRLQAMAAQGQ
ncbi:MAG TPA: tol-pal system protein YbgF [Gammaproteobacteria bacterium]|jgi:tol-pal system protein YbgF|nr:tol-pal system protein YbgF [Gammaproteobacteria bacterium]